MEDEMDNCDQSEVEKQAYFMDTWLPDGIQQ
jgi:hypothetical protein